MEEKIRIENVTKKFGSYAALDGISLNFEKGKIHGIIGRNGSGKTVLFKCICGFLRVDGGAVLVNGKQIGKEIEAPESIGAIIETPGFLPGYTQENNGIIRHGAKIVYAYVEATIPKITLILRKAYGGAYIVMSSKQTGSDVNLAYPTAEIAVMGPEGAANIIFRKEIKESANPEETRKQKVAEYREKFANPYVAASKGYIDSVIEPSETRLLLKHSIEVSGNKTVMTPAKKHGIPPF